MPLPVPSNPAPPIRVARLGFLLIAGLLLGLVHAQPTVVASIHPYYDLLRQIAGDRAEVRRLLAPGASPHGYDPAPRDVALLEGADLVLLNGGIDEWLLELVEASGSRARVVEALPLFVDDAIAGDDHADEAHDEEHGDEHDEEHDEHDDEHGDEHDEEHDEAHGDEHDHGGVNPHVWLDPLLMARLVPTLAAALSEIDPAGAADYAANAETLIADLEALDAELRALLAPWRGAPFVPFHDAWPYFAERYGLDLVVEIEPFPGREPSPRYLAEALEAIRTSGARVIFTEAQLGDRPARVLADEAGVALGTLDPIGGGPDTTTYQDLLRYNAAVIAGALDAAGTP